MQVSVYRKTDRFKEFLILRCLFKRYLFGLYNTWYWSCFSVKFSSLPYNVKGSIRWKYVCSPNGSKLNFSKMGMKILEPHQNIIINFESDIVKLSEKRDLVAISILGRTLVGFFWGGGGCGN